MAKFAFRLEALLRLARADEAEQKVVVGLCANEVRLNEERVEQKSRWLGDLISESNSGGTSHFVLTPSVHHSIKGAKEVLAASEVELVQKQLALIEAKRSAELIQKLKNRQQSRFLEEASAVEAKELLETSMNIALWRQR